MTKQMTKEDYAMRNQLVAECVAEMLNIREVDLMKEIKTFIKYQKGRGIGHAIKDKEARERPITTVSNIEADIWPQDSKMIASLAANAKT
jgi:hypothetical protein